MNPINLIPFARLEARRRRRRTRAWAAAGGSYALLLLFAVLTAHLMSGRPDHPLVEQLDRIDAEVAEAAAHVRELHPKLAEAHRRLEAARTVAIQPDWSILLALIGELRGEGVVLDRCALIPLPPASGNAGADEPVRSRIDVRGLGRDQTSISEFVLGLENTDLFDYVKLLETSRRSFASAEAVAFRIECALSEPGRAGASR